MKLRAIELALPAGMLAILGSCLGGCAAAGPKDVSEALMIVEKVQELAERQNLAYTARVRWNGKPSVGEDIEFYLGTGLEVEVSIQGNAAGSGPTP